MITSMITIIINSTKDDVWDMEELFHKLTKVENKVWCKKRRYFHFLLSLAYPIDRLDWALFSVVILFHHWFPLLEKIDNRAFSLPHNFPAVLIIFAERGRAGNPPSPQCGARSPPSAPHSVGRGGEPPLRLPARRVPWRGGAGWPSLPFQVWAQNGPLLIWSTIPKWVC